MFLYQTDDAWIVTEAYNFHDETETNFGKFEMNSGEYVPGLPKKYNLSTI